VDVGVEEFLAVKLDPVRYGYVAHGTDACG
jgi:hypothetical protein